MNLVRQLSVWWQNQAGLTYSLFRNWWFILILCLGIALVFWGSEWPIWLLLQDQAQLTQFVAHLGWAGPLALIAFNALQIIVAPVPGYVLQAVSGFLYGPLWGGIWGALGLLLGSISAMALTRRFGRGVVEQWIGVERLLRWENTTHSTSLLVWAFLLAAPIGDIPYFLAGLGRVSFTKIIVLTLMIRVPSVFVVAALGAGVIVLPWWQMLILFVGLGLLLLSFLRYQTHIQDWMDERIQRRLS